MIINTFKPKQNNIIRKTGITDNRQNFTAVENCNFGKNKWAYMSAEACYKRVLAQVPKLLPEEEEAVAALAKRGDRAAINRLVESHLHLPAAIAPQFTFYPGTLI